MEKLKTTTRYADTIGNYNVQADVVKDEKENKITTINNGNVTDTEKGISAWFNIDGNGNLNMGGVNANDSETLTSITDAIVEFYSKLNE